MEGNNWLATATTVYRQYDLPPGARPVLTRAKISGLEHILQEHKPMVVLSQETHTKESSQLEISGFNLAAYTKRNVHVFANFVWNPLRSGVT